MVSLDPNLVWRLAFQYLFFVRFNTDIGYSENGCAIVTDNNTTRDFAVIGRYTAGTIGTL
jgi:hypothetical protein